MRRERIDGGPECRVLYRDPENPCDCIAPTCQLDPDAVWFFECRATSWQIEGFAICRERRGHEGSHTWEIQ